VCRLLKLVGLPAAVIMAFSDPREIRESWGVTLAERCATPEIREQTLRIARTLKRREDGCRDPSEVYKRLLECRDRGQAVRTLRRDDVVRANDGRPLFRVSHRHNDLHIVIPRDSAVLNVLDQVASAIKTILETAGGPRRAIPRFPARESHRSRHNGWKSYNKDAGLAGSSLESSLARGVRNRAPALDA
jgi:hypothetical protein